jgi:hypothetical protein
VQILCITHQAQVAAQSDQHLLVKKRQTDPASSTILSLEEDERINELARMTGVEINDTTATCQAITPAKVPVCLEYVDWITKKIWRIGISLVTW